MWNLIIASLGGEQNINHKIFSVGAEFILYIMTCDFRTVCSFVCDCEDRWMHSVQMCYIVCVQLELLTVILHQDNTSVKINSSIALGLDGVLMTLKWILSNTYSSHGVSVRALLITLALFETLEVWSFSESWVGCARMIWHCSLVGFISTFAYFCRDALLFKLDLDKSLCLVSSSLPRIAHFVPSSFASFPVFPPCQFYMSLLPGQKMATVRF